jgi:hypothetical protein
MTVFHTRRQRGRVRRTGGPPPCANHRRPDELRLLPLPTRRQLHRPPGFSGFTRFRELMDLPNREGAVDCGRQVVGYGL